KPASTGSPHTGSAVQSQPRSTPPPASNSPPNSSDTPTVASPGCTTCHETRSWTQQPRPTWRKPSAPRDSEKMTQAAHTSIVERGDLICPTRTHQKPVIGQRATRSGQQVGRDQTGTTTTGCTHCRPCMKPRNQQKLRKNA